MKKALLVLSLAVLTSLGANATPKPKFYNFGLTGHCDTFSFYTYSAYSGAPAVAISGQHHCGQFPIENVGGFVHALSSYYQVGTGTVFDFHDSEYSDWFGEPGYDSDWIVSWKAGTWVLYVSNGTGTVFDFHDSEYSDWFGEPGYNADWIVNWKAGTWGLYVSNRSEERRLGK